MLRLLRFVVILIVVCYYGIALARQIGLRSPDPLAEWFTNPDGSRCPMPCLFGIQPGITTYEDAIKLVSVHPLTRDMQKATVDGNSFEFGDSQFCSLISHDTKDKVEEIMVSAQNCEGKFVPYTAPQKITPIQLIALVGSPQSVILGSFGAANDLYFMDGQLTLNVGVADTSCDISPYTNYNVLALTEYDGRGGAAVNWKGFVNRKLYDPSLC